MSARTYYVLWFLIALVHLANLRLDVMDVDAAQYASMSAEMCDNHSYLEVFHRGKDYLDKPPLLFWLSSASFAVFGVSNITYKLPALLILFLGLWSLYRLVRLLDDTETARIAVTIAATTQAFFLMTNDVRTDGLLTGFVVLACYGCVAYLREKKWSNLILAGIGIGCAMLAKGPIGAAIPALMIGCHLLLKGRWRDIFRPAWLVPVVIAVLLILPMCYGLYTQFDQHPEKMVYGLEGPSGLRFFFWTQSFGRITGEIYWNNHLPPTFFITSFLWDFMPWVLIYGTALVFALRSIFAQKTAYPEYLSTGGFLLIFVLLSSSQYKLPHYIFPLFPFAAMLTARYLRNPEGKRKKALSWVQFGMMHLFFGIMTFAYIRAFHPDHWILPVITSAGLLALWFSYFNNRASADRLVLGSAITAITFNAFMALHFYPQIMQYQSGAAAGKIIAADKQVSNRQYYAFRDPTYTLDFYAGKYVPLTDIDAFPELKSGAWIYLTEEHLGEIDRQCPGTYRIIETLDHYHITMLKFSFVLADQRPDNIRHRYIIEKT